MALAGFSEEFYGARFLPIVNQMGHDGKPRWTDADVQTVIPFVTIASVDKWDLKKPTDEQLRALDVTQKALKLPGFEDQNAVNQAINTYYMSGGVKAELAQAIFRAVDEPEPEPVPEKKAGKGKKKPDLKKKKRMEVFQKEAFDDSAARKTSMQKLTGNESGVNVKRAPKEGEEKPEGTIDLGTLAHQLSGRRRI